MKKAIIFGIMIVAAMTFTTGAAMARGAVDGPVVYVTGQGLYYDSLLAARELPNKGPFQELYPCDEGLCTEFGPGDHGHRGGRWWIDMNTDGEMDEGDSYFSCPLLGPGRETMD